MHCGRSTGGDYISTISAVDIATNWWEGQAITVRSQHATKEAMEQTRLAKPFNHEQIRHTVAAVLAEPPPTVTDAHPRRPCERSEDRGLRTRTA